MHGFLPKVVTVCKTTGSKRTVPRGILAEGFSLDFGAVCGFGVRPFGVLLKPQRSTEGVRDAIVLGGEGTVSGGSRDAGCN